MYHPSSRRLSTRRSKKIGDCGINMHAGRRE
jgi:hypothetical protein